MTPVELEEAHDSFVAERAAMLMYCAEMSPENAVREAERLWVQYKKDFKLVGNEQGALICLNG